LVLLGGASVSHGQGVLVLGGTGQLGSDVVRLLLAADNDVTVFARPKSDRSRLDGLDVEFVVGDLLDDESVAAAFAGRQYRAVVNTVRAPISDVPFYDISSALIAKHARAAGVKQIIHHGAVGAGDNVRLHPDVPWDRVPGLAGRMRDHGKAEENFFASGITTTVIRNSRVWPHGTPSTGQATLSEDPATMTPITRADLALMTMQCLDNPACAGKVYHAKDESLTWPAPGMGQE
jgi:uncharacterized protein YbjT (DUF2867 family)